MTVRKSLKNKTINKPRRKRRIIEEKIIDFIMLFIHMFKYLYYNILIARTNYLKYIDKRIDSSEHINVTVDWNKMNYLRI